MYNPRGRGRTSGLALYLLLAQMAQVGFDKIPPVTLTSIAAQVAIFLRLFDFSWMRSGLDNVCISALHVWYRNDWKRLLFATFFHADEWHLYFNMVSMLWKGIKLEKRFGSVYFLILIGVFSILVNMILVILSMCADQMTHDHSYITECAVGFSGVLFALKVVLNEMEASRVQYVMGLPIPSRFVCWVELILIHVLVPNASFLGHLSGIIAGLLYITGPLKTIMRILFFMLPDTGSTEWMRSSTNWGSGVTGTRIHPAEQASTSSRGYIRSYTGGISEEDQLSRAVEESISLESRTRLGSPDGDRAAIPPDLDDVRRRRLNRFNAYS